MDFRKDINGLRAIAVIAVVLFHFNSSLMPGGFAGVDVFFVISGFLMTGIIFKGLDNGNFSILNFYRARVRRIVPPLAFLCFVLVVFGWLFLTAVDYNALLKHAVSSISFLSNIIYWRESGYFDPSSHEKWLLHTWSLSVEWQFYLLFPLFLVAARKMMSLNATKIFFVICTFLGLILSVLLTYKLPSAAYYLLPARAWEMMAGGVAYLYPWTIRKERKKVLELTGLVLIVCAYLFVSGDSPWPGYLALLPVLGAFLVIQARCDQSIITGNVAFQKIGAWSYSIYLWHWPLVVLFYYQFESNVIGIPLSVLLGYISYKCFERKESIPRVMAGSALLAVPFLAVAVNSNVDTVRGDKIQSERQKFLYEYSNPECNFRAYNPESRRQEDRSTISDKCFTSDKRAFLIHGDSHAIHLFHGLKENLTDHDVLQVGAFSCRLSGGRSSGCEASIAFFRENIGRINPEVLILSQRNGYEDIDWSAYLEPLKTIKSVVILGPSPETNMNRLVYRGDEVITNMEYIEGIDSMLWSSEAINKHDNVTYISMKEVLCGPSNHECKVEVDGNSIYADDGHFSRFGSEYVARRILAILDLPR